MRQIRLTQDKYALVDDKDFEYISQWKWHFDGRYARRAIFRKTGNEYIYMHRFINGTPEGMETDHVNRDSLDNRRENLRSCNRQQNMSNRNKMPNNTSGLTGVCFDKTTTNKLKKWLSRIKVNGKSINLGRHETKEEAGRIYDDNAIKYFGEFASLNFEKGGQCGYSA